MLKPRTPLFQLSGGITPEIDFTSNGGGTTRIKLDDLGTAQTVVYTPTDPTQDTNVVIHFSGIAAQVGLVVVPQLTPIQPATDTPPTDADTAPAAPTDTNTAPADDTAPTNENTTPTDTSSASNNASSNQVPADPWENVPVQMPTFTESDGKMITSSQPEQTVAAGTYLRWDFGLPEIDNSDNTFHLVVNSNNSEIPNANFNIYRNDNIVAENIAAFTPGEVTAGNYEVRVITPDVESSWTLNCSYSKANKVHN